MIAVKRLRQLQGLDNKEFENEFRNVSKVNHENVVKLLGYCHASRRKFVKYDGEDFFATEMERIFCFEYMQGGSLDKHITGTMISEALYITLFLAYVICIFVCFIFHIFRR